MSIAWVWVTTRLCSPVRSMLGIELVGVLKEAVSQERTPVKEGGPTVPVVSGSRIPAEVAVPEPQSGAGGCGFVFDSERVLNELSWMGAAMLYPTVARLNVKVIGVPYSFAIATEKTVINKEGLVKRGSLCASSLKRLKVNDNGRNFVSEMPGDFTSLETVVFVGDEGRGCFRQMEVCQRRLVEFSVLETVDYRVVRPAQR
eukprot:GHVU01037853.1.p1 GENE.GHVU01037853.1~~GHVU01037853.1.p1  ORF type:complete len:201 (+),score=11.14 GHVU01037853.1:842-1444(+)